MLKTNEFNINGVNNVKLLEFTSIKIGYRSSLVIHRGCGYRQHIVLSLRDIFIWYGSGNDIIESPFTSIIWNAPALLQ